MKQSQKRSRLSARLAGLHPNSAEGEQLPGHVLDAGAGARGSLARPSMN